MDVETEGLEDFDFNLYFFSNTESFHCIGMDFDQLELTLKFSKYPSNRFIFSFTCWALKIFCTCVVCVELKIY